MHHFHPQDGELHAEGVSLSRIAAEVGTPVYVYSTATIARHLKAFDGAFGDRPRLVAYSVKANGNLALLALLAKLGAGMDIVSGGELRRCRRAGVEPSRIVFSGVGKQPSEMAEALAAGIKMFNVESEAELSTLEDIARQSGLVAPIAVRVNPEVDAKTHPYIATGLSESKFGVAADVARAIYRRAAASAHLRVVGIDCHIGSQVVEMGPFVEAVGKVASLAKALRGEGIPIRVFDIGGGLGISYREGTPPPPHPTEYGAAIAALLDREGLEDVEIVVEPGRAILGNAGVLLTRVVLLKESPHKRFAIVDAAMNDLVRPSLYGSWHEIAPVRVRSGDPRVVDVVGPVCESGDFLAKDRSLPPLEAGDLLAVFSAGAYGFVMSSNYNARPRPAEVLVDGDALRVIRDRETFEDLIRGERA